jgi:hypothetical protein
LWTNKYNNRLGYMVRYYTVYWANFVASWLSQQDITLALNVCRGPTGFQGGLYTQILS